MPTSAARAPKSSAIASASVDLPPPGGPAIPSSVRCPRAASARARSIASAVVSMPSPPAMSEVRRGRQADVVLGQARGRGLGALDVLEPRTLQAAPEAAPAAVGHAVGHGVL